MTLSKLSQISLIILIFLSLPACRTTTSTVQQLNPRTGQEELIIEGNHRQALLAALRSQRLKHGISDSDMRIIRYSGILQCRIDGQLQHCTVRTEIPSAPFYSLGAEIPTQLGKNFLHYAYKSRPDIENDRVVVADIKCDITTEDAPPYQKRQESCRATDPRRPSEVYFYEPLASELQEGMITQAISTTRTQPNFSCNWLRQGVQCQLDSPAPTVNGEAPTSEPEILNSSQPLAQKLLDAYRLTKAIYEPDSRQIDWQPEMIQAALHCRNEELPNKPSAGQATTCRATL